MPEPDFRQLSEITFLLRGGGLPYFGFGLLLAIWGAVNVAVPRYRWSIRLQAILSLLPGIVALFAIHAATTAYLEMAVAPMAPKPAEWAAATGKAMSCGFFGILCTVLPAGLGIVALWRY